MTSPRQLGRSLLARVVARILIAGLLLSLVPPSAEASIPRAPLPEPRPLEDLGTARSEPACLLVVVVLVADPVWLTKSAFGELLAHTGTDPQPYAFAGEPLDPNVGFQYHRARWMDPRVGRFVGMDPWGGTASDPRTLHRYLYATGDPADMTDPSGRNFTIGGMMTVGAIIGILASNALLQPRTIREGVEASLAGAAVGALVGYGLALWLSGSALGAAATGGVLVGPTGSVSRQLLEQATNSNGPTQLVVTGLTRAPTVGRTLYVAVGPTAEQVATAANAARGGGSIYQAQVPMELWTRLMQTGLIRPEMTEMLDRTRALAYAIEPEAVEYLVPFFEKVR